MRKSRIGAPRVFVGDTEVHLTPIEYRWLTTLVRHAGKVLTHRQILKEVWGPDSVEQAHRRRTLPPAAARHCSPLSLDLSFLKIGGANSQRSALMVRGAVRTCVTTSGVVIPCIKRKSARSGPESCS
jgi:Transcriptional regulatory protein, C terminal